MEGINVNITVNKPPTVSAQPVARIPSKNSETLVTRERALSAARPIVQNRLPNFIGGYYK